MSVKIKLKRDKHQTFFNRFDFELVDLGTMQKKLSLTQGFKVFTITHRIGRDVEIVQNYVVAIEPGKASGKTGLPVSKRLHFTARQYKAGLDYFQDKIIPAGFVMSGDER